MNELQYPSFWKNRATEAAINFCLDIPALGFSSLGLLCLSPAVAEARWIAIGHNHHMPELFFGLCPAVAGMLFAAAWAERMMGDDVFAFKRVKSEVAKPKTDEPPIAAAPPAPARPSQTPLTVEQIFGAGHRAEEYQRALAASNNLAVTMVAVSILSPG
jgi:hypothetical protein